MTDNVPQTYKPVLRTLNIAVKVDIHEIIYHCLNALRDEAEPMILFQRLFTQRDMLMLATQDLRLHGIRDAQESVPILYSPEDIARAYQHMATIFPDLKYMMKHGHHKS